MKIGLVVDSACDLPKRYIDRHRIQVLPISIRIADTLYADDRQPATLKAFYEERRLDKDQDAESVPLSEQ